MKIRKTKVNLIEKSGEPPKQNPVAKFAGRFNKAKVFEDKNKYSRKAKHANQEASPSVQFRRDGKASCIFTAILFGDWWLSA